MSKTGNFTLLELFTTQVVVTLNSNSIFWGKKNAAVLRECCSRVRCSICLLLDSVPVERLIGAKDFRDEVHLFHVAGGAKEKEKDVVKITRLRAESTALATQWVTAIRCVVTGQPVDGNAALGGVSVTLAHRQTTHTKDLRLS
jgi:hypothetical protein